MCWSQVNLVLGFNRAAHHNPANDRQTEAVAFLLKELWYFHLGSFSLLELYRRKYADTFLSFEDPIIKQNNGILTISKQSSIVERHNAIKPMSAFTRKMQIRGENVIAME